MEYVNSCIQLISEEYFNIHSDNKLRNKKIKNKVFFSEVLNWELYVKGIINGVIRKVNEILFRLHERNIDMFASTA